MFLLRRGGGVCFLFSDVSKPQAHKNRLFWTCSRSCARRVRRLHSAAAFAASGLCCPPGVSLFSGGNECSCLL